MKLSDYVVEYLTNQGIDLIFEFIGGAITHLIDSTYHRDDIECVSVHHEQSAAFAAEAYARLRGLGVAMATSGPGALNMLTGIGSCWFDSVPCLFITGQVNTYEYKFDRPVRQIGFQETDIVSVAKPLTKHALMVTDPETIRYHLEQAVWIARSGRPGPVLLDIPMNVQRADVDPEKLVSFFDAAGHIPKEPEATPENLRIKAVAQALSQSKRPLILAGGGIRSDGATALFRQLVMMTGIPVVASLMGLDTLPHDMAEFTGMIGSYGHRYSNFTLANCDLLLVLGSRLDSRQTGTRPDSFARAALKIHVDIDANELNAKVKTDYAIHSHIGTFLELLIKALEETPRLDIENWYSAIESYKKRYPTTGDVKGADRINPNRFFEQLSDKLNLDDTVTLDVGQNQMWAAQSIKLKGDQRLLVSGGMGAMGFSLPAAIGAAMARQGKKVVSISGDGGIQVNIQELEVVVSRKLPVIIIVLDNRSLGMVRQFQDLYFGGRRQSTVIGYGVPDLKRIAEAYGVPAFSIDHPEQINQVLELAFQEVGPVFIHVCLELETDVNPKLVVNRPLEDMSPHLDRSELADNMLIPLLPDGDRSA
jgi:acetolactate synthase-1/2/3 large subunit